MTQSRPSGGDGPPPGAGHPGPRHRARRTTAVVVGAAATAALAAALVAGAAALAPTPPHGTDAPGVPGTASAPPPGPAPSPPPPSARPAGAPPTAEVQQPPAAAAPERLDYPAAGASAAVHALTPTAADLAAHALEPPETKDAYWLTNYGQPGAGSTDTTYIVAHRWVGTDAPFNHIGEKAKPGDAFTLTTTTGTLRYRVVSVQEIGKAELAASPIWAVAPDRVILITCDFSDPWGKNTVITADPLS
ncbi:sortase domain-containing protein [Sinomonas sp. RB5]